MRILHRRTEGASRSFARLQRATFIVTCSRRFTSGYLLSAAAATRQALRRYARRIYRLSGYTIRAVKLPLLSL
jgi:predicted Zn-dependent peptidase